MEVAIRANIRRLLIAVAVCFVVLSASFTHAQTPSDEARSYFERGVEASRNNRWREARILFQRSLDLVAKPSTLLNLAITELRLGNGEEALERLNAFRELATPVEHADMLDRAKVLVAQAQALIESEQSSASAGKRSLAPERKETDDGLSEEAKVEIGKARDHYARGNDKEALAAFERAYELSKKPSLLYQVGVVADRLRADARAVQAYEAFAAALPDAPEAAVAQVRSTALRAAMEERAKQRAASAAMAPQATQRRDGLPPVRPALRAPRALVVTGTMMFGVTGGLLAWYANRTQAVNKCESWTIEEDGGNCGARYSSILRQKRAALATSIASAGLAVGLTATGIGMLTRRKRTSTAAATNLLLYPDLALDEHGRGLAGLAVHGRF